MHAAEWLEENACVVREHLDDIIHDIRKEYKKNRIAHEKRIDVLCGSDKIEYHVFEIPIFGSVESVGDEIFFPSPLAEGELEEMSFFFEDLMYDYADRGFQCSPGYADDGTLRLAIEW